MRKPTVRMKDRGTHYLGAIELPLETGGCIRVSNVGAFPWEAVKKAATAAMRIASDPALLPIIGPSGMALAQSARAVSKMAEQNMPLLRSVSKNLTPVAKSLANSFIKRASTPPKSTPRTRTPRTPRGSSASTPSGAQQPTSQYGIPGFSIRPGQLQPTAAYQQQQQQPEYYPPGYYPPGYQPDPGQPGGEGYIDPMYNPDNYAPQQAPQYDAYTSPETEGDEYYGAYDDGHPYASMQEEYDNDDNDYQSYEEEAQ